MSTTVKHLGFLPKNRGEYASGERYYKDNIAQYQGFSFIADPVGYDEQSNPNAYVTAVPFDIIPTSCNAGWRPFALGAYDEVVELGEQAKQFVSDANAIVESYAPIQITGDVTNAPDEEDLTSENVQGTDVIKLKDKAYAPTVFSGMGRKYLRKNVQEVTVDDVTTTKNVLTQEMMPLDTGQNIIYHIQYDYDLNGETITVPEGCVLEFEGGSLSNGSVNFNACIISSDSFCFKDNLIPTDNSIIQQDINPIWFGAVGDGVHDDTTAWENCINFARKVNNTHGQSFRNYGRTFGRISAEAHNRFLITRQLWIDFQFDIVGNFWFIYYGAYPSLNEGIINFTGIFSECIYEFNVIHSRLNPSSTSAFYPNWTNVPQYAGVAFGSEEHPILLENSTIKIRVLNCLVGIRLCGTDGGHHISNNIFEKCGFYKCMTGILNTFHNGSWNNDLKFINCSFRQTGSGYVPPADFQYAAFIKVDGDYDYNMNASYVNGLSLEGKPINGETLLLWVNKEVGYEGTMSSFIIDNIRVEAIGTYLVVTNALINNWSIRIKHSDYKILCKGAEINPMYVPIPNSTMEAKYLSSCEKNKKSFAIRPHTFGTYKLLDNQKESFSNTNGLFFKTDAYTTSLIAYKGPVITIPSKSTIAITSNTTYIIMFLDSEYNRISRPEIVTPDYYAYPIGQEEKWGLQAPVAFINKIMYIYNTTDADIICAIKADNNTNSDIDIYGSDITVHTFNRELIKTSGLLSERPYSIPSAFNGLIYNATDINRAFTWNGYMWLFEDGFSSDKHTGATSERPTLSLFDNGFKYFDTDLNNDLHAIVTKTAILEQVISAKSSTHIDNTIPEGTLCWAGYSNKQSYGGKLIFRKEIDQTEDQIEILSNFNNTSLGSYAVTPDPSIYKYIYFYNGWTREETVGFYGPFISWVEQDGATAGVLRSGNTASRPVGSNIYIGFMYMDTEVGKPIYAKTISEDTVTWVDATGTEV